MRHSPASGAQAALQQPPEHGGKRVNIFRGTCEISDDPEVYFATILGSCISVCLRDPVAKVGGMNHFLLPGTRDSGELSLSHGVHAMELLINALLKQGAQKRRLEAKLFGGAHVVSGVKDIGRSNSAFAERFLSDEGISCVARSLGGVQARRLHFWPVSGKVRQLLLPISEAPAPEPVVADDPPAGELDLF